MKEYNFSEIEKKWQDIWEKEKRYEVANRVEGKENCYVLIEFPYPSGKGLHTGHIRSYASMDAVARKKRLQGYNVLFPMGCDSFGLEAERTAIRERKLPQEIVARNIATFKSQLKTVGLSFDWSREISTADPDYYKWTQWLFLQFYKHGLAEKRTTTINWCPNCGVLANEEIENGHCCQCGAETVQKPKAQWVLKMTEYADRLDKDLDQTNYMEHIKLGQKNWIGRSEGVQVKFQIVGGGEFEIFTTCIETIYGITFMVLAPEHPLVSTFLDKIKNREEVEKYIKEASKKSDFERTEMVKTKTGCPLDGITCINPVNGKEVPLFIGDFVLANYGTGAVMAVPAHDQRDYDYAKAHGIDMIQVIDGKSIDEKAFEKQEYLGVGCKLINSAEFSGMTVEDAKKAITAKLEAEGVAKKVLNFRMRDWIFSRQRYWGEPIPMIYCKECGWVPVPDKDLPVTLPIVDSYEPTKDGESPLSVIDEWVNVPCPCCGKPARRETDTMPGWAGSSWYFLRYCDPKNDKEFASMDALKAWLPVNLYNGGNEHTNRHLLYARFWVKFLYDIGLSPVSEPFMSRVSQGIILGSNGVKMSKSLGNVVDPRDVIKEYGADSLRLWEAFIGDYFATCSWDDNGTKACNKFLNKVWALQGVLTDDENMTKDLEYILHTTIKKVTEDIDNCKFNTAVAQLMTCVNEMQKVGKVSRDDYRTLLLLLNPFAPHITEELWNECSFTPKFENAVWPTYDESKLVKAEVEIVAQINSKIRGRLTIAQNATQDEVVAAACKQLGIDSSSIIKVIYIAGRLINFIVKK